MNSFNVISSLSQSAPVTFVGKQVVLWAGRTVVLFSTISPIIAVASTIALSLILGLAVCLYKYKQLNTAYNQLNNTYQNEKAEVRVLQGKLSNDTMRMSGHEDELKGLRDELKNKDDELAGKNGELAQLKQILGNKDAEIARLQTIAQASELSAKAALAKMQTANSELEKARQHINRLQEEKGDFKDAFEQANEGLERVKSELAHVVAQKNDLNLSNKELQDDLKKIETLLAHAQKAQESEMEASQLEFSRLGLSLSLSKSWVKVSSEPRKNELVNEGKLFLNSVLGASKEELETIIINIREKNEGSQKVAMIVWALMNLAKVKEQAFEEGAFICKDENGNLSTLLQQLGTPRISSHLKGIAEDTHYGIDVPPTEEFFLPEHKRHVLIAAIDKPELCGRRIFIKPENFGVTTSADLLGHAYEYIHSLGRKVNPSVFGSDDASDYRKERVPQELLKEFKIILEGLGKLELPGLEVDPYTDAKKFGVSAMLKFVNERIKRNHLSGVMKDKLVEFRDKLYSMDNAEVRIGREVIIDNLSEIVHKHFIEVVSAS